MTDAVNSVLLPALNLVKHIWTGLMDGIKATWEQYGEPICDGVVEAFNWILAILQSLWDTAVKPFLQYCIEKGTELWDQTLKPLWDNFVGMAADIIQYILTWWNEVLLPFINWICLLYTSRAVLHDSAELKDARANLRAHLAAHRPPERMTGAVRLGVKWCFPVCSGHHYGEYRTSKPDTDNLEKLLKDVMTELGFWMDDAQVASELCEKFWAEIPGIYILLTGLEE